MRLECRVMGRVTGRKQDSSAPRNLHAGPGRPREEFGT